MKKIMALAIVIALPGCAGFIETRKVDFSEINEGITYYLPKRQHNLVVTAENLNAKDEEKKYKAAEKIFDAENDRASELKTQWEKLQAEADNTPVGEDGEDTEARAKAVEKAQTARGIYLAAKEFADNAKQKMEIAKSRYAQAKARKDATKCNYYITMSISPLKLEPDTKHPFLLKLNSSPVRDDELKVKTGHSGLLTSADVTSTDRTGDIAVEIAKAVAIFGIGLPSPVSLPKATMLPKQKQPLKECYPTVLKHEEVVDFGNSDIRTTTGKAIVFKDSSGLKVSSGDYVLPPSLNVYVDINSSDEKTDLGEIYATVNDKNAHYPLKGHSGIFYRRDTTYMAYLRKGEEKIADEQILMPNLSPVSLLPYKYLPLVTTKNNAVFENGMLMEYETNRPSSLLALATLPARVAEGYINALTNFLQLRINYSSKGVEALNKEKEFIDLQRSIQDALKEEN